MASPADSSSQEAVIRKQNKGAPIKFLVPLIYAPVLPLIRLSLRRNPVLRDRLFTAVLAGAFVHGFYLVLTLADSIQVIVWDGKSIRMQKLVGITRHEELTYMMLRANKHAQHELLRAI